MVVVVESAIESMHRMTMYADLLNMSIPVLDQLLMVLEERFAAQQLMVTNALYLVPTVIESVTREHVTANVQACVT